MAIILAEEVWIFVVDRQVEYIMTATLARQRRLISQEHVFVKSLKKGKRKLIRLKICFQERQVTLRKEIAKLSR